MKVFKMILIGIVTLTLVVSLTFHSNAIAKDLPKFVYIATNPQGSIYYSFGSVMGKILDDHSGIRARVQPSGGSSAYIPAVSQGKIDLGVNNANDVRMAYRGMKAPSGSPETKGAAT